MPTPPLPPDEDPQAVQDAFEQLQAMSHPHPVTAVPSDFPSDSLATLDWVEDFVQAVMHNDTEEIRQITESFRLIGSARRAEDIRTLMEVFFTPCTLLLHELTKTIPDRDALVRQLNNITHRNLKERLKTQVATTIARNIHLALLEYQPAIPDRLFDLGRTIGGITWRQLEPDLAASINTTKKAQNSAP